MRSSATSREAGSLTAKRMPLPGIGSPHSLRSRALLVVHPMRAQRAAANPPIDSLLGDIQQARDVSNFELHGRSYLTGRRK